jgi:ActR/RegA family two-component response regulator
MAAEAKTLIPPQTDAIIDIVVMEDEDMFDIIAALESHGCRVCLVSSREEAVEMAESKRARFFILDISMGSDRFNEGLDTLEEIKKIDEDIFVAIYTKYPEERYRYQAENLGADLFFAKTPDVRADIRRITERMLPHAFKLLGSEERDKRRPEPDDEEEQYSEEFALNYNAFKDLLADDKSSAENFGYYVAFVNGRMVKRSRDEDELISWLISEHPRTPKFYALVQDEEDEAVEYLPSPLFTEDL